MNDKAADVLNRSDVLLKEAEEQAEARISELKEERSRRKKSLIKIGVMLFFIALVLIFSTIAWFSSNKNTSASGSRIKVLANGFELQVEDGDDSFSDLYSLLSDDYGSTDKLKTNATDENGDTVYWRMESADGMLMPSAQGAMEFEVIAGTSDFSNLKYSLTVHGFEAETETVVTNLPNGTTSTEVNVLSLTEITSSSQAAKVSGLKYLKSHIMFFKNRTGSSAEGYQYSGFIDDITDFQLDPVDGTENKFVIYWIWPNTFGQIALTGSTADQKYTQKALPVLNTEGETADRSAVTDYIKLKEGNASKMFEGSETDFNALIDSLYTKRSGGTNYEAEYDSLSDGYNSADQIIGKNVDYTLVELKVVG